MTIFNFNVLKLEPWRYIGFLIAILPLLCIFIFGSIWKPTSKAGEIIKSRPPGYAFGIAWTIVTISWFISCFIATLNFTELLLICYFVFTILAILICCLWLYYYHINSKYIASQILILLPLFAFAIFACCTNATQGFVPSLLILPLCIWSMVALVLSLLEVAIL